MLTRHSIVKYSLEFCRVDSTPVPITQNIKPGPRKEQKSVKFKKQVSVRRRLIALANNYLSQLPNFSLGNFWSTYRER